MYRIILMVVRLFYKVPYYLMRIWWLGTRKNFNLEENYAFIKKVTKAANRAGRVKIESYGLEKSPKETGWRWIRTTEASCSRFTVCPLWPLGNPSMSYFLDSYE